MRKGRPKVALILTAAERQQLEVLVHLSRSTAMARRARIILACAEGAAGIDVARRLRVRPGTVSKWRRRFLKHRLNGLRDEPRPGAKRRVTDTQVEQVIIRTLDSRPTEGAHWSTRGMAKAVGLSHTAVSRIWRTFGLQPQRGHSRDPSDGGRRIHGTRSVAALYLDPPMHAAVFCVEGNRETPSLDPTPFLPSSPPGQVSPRLHADGHHGISALLGALGARADDVIARPHQRQRAPPFRECLDLLDARVPARLDVHVVIDTGGTNGTAAIRNWFARHPRFHAYFTPTHGAWLSLVEWWFARPRRTNGGRPLPAARPLTSAIREFNETREPDSGALVWIRNAGEILAGITRIEPQEPDASERPAAGREDEA